jgi:hypothetical protein
VRTFTHLTNLDPGFDPDRVVTAAIFLEDARYRAPRTCVVCSIALSRHFAKPRALRSARSRSGFRTSDS